MPATRMTPRQRVHAALRHQTPDRVPFSWQFCATDEEQAILTRDLAAQGLDWPRLRGATEDIAWAGPRYTGPDLSTPGRPRDMWGIVWKDVNYGGGTYREVAVPPLAGVDSLQALANFPWPNPEHYDYADFARQARARFGAPDRAHKYGAGNPFETYCWMTGLEESLVNLAAQPALVVAALESITAFYEQRLERAVRAGGQAIDIVFFFDDLGTQQGPMLSPAMYRDILLPFHRRLFQLAHRLAPQAPVMMHSDGSVFDLLPDLIAAGLDVLEAVQTDTAGMAPERLKDAYGDRLAFHGAISVQQLLPLADPATVRREVRRLLDVLGRDGGYVAAPAHAIQVGTPTANVLAMLETVLGPKDFPAALAAARGPK